VSTADKKGLGSVADAPWTIFASKLTRDAKASVVPVYFPGHNRHASHPAYHIAEPLRMALMRSEARNRLGKPLDAVAGETPDWQALSQCASRQGLTNYPYGQVQTLARTLPSTNVTDHPTHLLLIPND